MRPPRSLAWRLAPIAVVLTGLAIANHFYGTQETELLVVVPPGSEEIRALDLRVTRADGKLVLQARRTKSSERGRTIVFDTKLPRGRFVVDAYPDPPGPPLTGALEFGGEDSVEVDLAPR